MPIRSNGPRRRGRLTQAGRYRSTSPLDPRPLTPDPIPVTFEVRLIIVLLFFALWSLLGFLPWSFAAVIRRGRDVLLALPLALAAASLAGVLVPLLGARDETGFLLSIGTAFVGGILGTLGGILLALRLSAAFTPSSAHDQPAKEDASKEA